MTNLDSLSTYFIDCEDELKDLKYKYFSGCLYVNFFLSLDESNYSVIFVLL